MVDTIPLLSKLFAGIPRQDGVALMNEMGATIRKTPAGGIVLREGSLKRNIGVLLDGSLEMYETDVDGHRSMVGMVYPQESFALVFAFAVSLPGKGRRSQDALHDECRGRGVGACRENLRVRS